LGIFYQILPLGFFGKIFPKVRPAKPPEKNIGAVRPGGDRLSVGGHRSCFALLNMMVLKEAPSRKAASGMRGELMSGPSDHELAELRKTFDSCDLNGDGFINPEEFHALLIRLDGDVSREECQLDFDVADSEGDGYIGFKEFVVWWTG